MNLSPRSTVRQADHIDKQSTETAPLVADTPTIQERVGQNIGDARNVVELLSSLNSPRSSADHAHDGVPTMKRGDALTSLPTASPIVQKDRKKPSASRTDSYASGARAKQVSPRSTGADLGRDRLQQGCFRPRPGSSIEAPERKVKFKDARPDRGLQRSHAQTKLQRLSSIGSPTESPTDSPSESPRKPSRLERLITRSGNNSPLGGKSPASSRRSVDEKKAKRASLQDRSRTVSQQAPEKGVVGRLHKSLSPRKNMELEGFELRPKSPEQPEETTHQLKAQVHRLKEENFFLKQDVQRMTRQFDIFISELQKSPEVSTELLMKLGQLISPANL